ncbi:uncharacterized protein NPIL_45001 [Nephila pilipes]|uniref:Uncharacterized protein n=1 Tax=Nephila pilipes TaxID=299642 RepID=A0A8X6QHR5_NEPPI|nr:uncharacterized protein NPIL_45001 [Nephila pilipes]
MDRKKPKKGKKKNKALRIKVHDVDHMTKNELEYYILMLKQELDQVQSECNFSINYRKKLDFSLTQERSKYLRNKEIHTSKDFELLHVTHETEERLRDSRQISAFSCLKNQEQKVFKNITEYLNMIQDNLLKSSKREKIIEKERIVDDKNLLSKIASADLIAYDLFANYKNWSDDIFFEHILKFRDSMQSFNAIKQRILNSIWNLNLGDQEPVSEETEQLQYYFNELHQDNLKTLQMWRKKVECHQEKLEKVTLDLNKALSLYAENKSNKNTLQIQSPSPEPRKLHFKFSMHTSKNLEMDKIVILNFELTNKLKTLKAEREKLRNKFILNVRKIYRNAEFKALVAEEILRIGVEGKQEPNFTQKRKATFEKRKIIEKKIIQ